MNFYRDVMVLISDFISFITCNNAEIIKNKTVETVNANEFPQIDLFKSRSKAIIYLLENRIFNFEVKYSALDLRLIGELMMENNVNKLISILIKSPTIRVKFFKKGTFFEIVAEYLMFLRSNGPFWMISTGDAVQKNGITFEFENNVLKKVHDKSTQYEVENTQNSLLEILIQITGHEIQIESELDNECIDYDFINSIMQDSNSIIYTSIFNDIRSMKGFLRDFYAEAFNISCDIIFKQNYRLFSDWSAILKYIATISKQNNISLTSEFWNKIAKSHPQIVTAIINFNLKQFQNSPILCDFQSRLEKINLEIDDSENSSIQRRKRQLQKINEYINKKEPHYEVLKWFIDKGIFSTNISSTILALMIDYAKIEIYIPKKFNINEFGSLYIDSENNEQTDWFFYIAKHSYIIYLINQLKQTKSLYAIRELMKHYTQLKSKFMKLYKLDQEILSEISKKLSVSLHFSKRRV